MFQLKDYRGLKGNLIRPFKHDLVVNNMSNSMGRSSMRPIQLSHMAACKIVNYHSYQSR